MSRVRRPTHGSTNLRDTSLSASRPTSARPHSSASTRQELTQAETRVEYVPSRRPALPAAGMPRRPHSAAMKASAGTRVLEEDYIRRPTTAARARVVGRALQEKVMQRAPKLRHIFRLFDSMNTGQVYPAQFHKALATLNVVASRQQADNMFALIDRGRAGFITFEQFKEAIQLPDMESAYDRLVHEQSHSTPRATHSGAHAWGEEDASEACRIPAEASALRALVRQKIAECVENKTAFLKFDRDRDGLVTRIDMKEALEKVFGIIASDEEISSLMGGRHSMDLPAFVKEFVPRSTNEPPPMGQPKIRGVVAKPGSEAQSVSLDSAARLLREKVKARFGTVAEAFHRFDDDRDGFLSAEEFQAGLASLQLKFPREVINQLIDDISPYNGGMLNFAEFTACLSPSKHEQRRRQSARTHTTADAAQDPWLPAEVKATAGLLASTIESAFHDADANNTGVVTQAQAQQSVQFLQSVLPGEVLSCLMEEIDACPSDNIDYRSLIDKFVSEGPSLSHRWTPAPAMQTSVKQEGHPLPSPVYPGTHRSHLSEPFDYQPSRTANVDRQVDIFLVDVQERAYRSRGKIRGMFRCFDNERNGNLTHEQFLKGLALLNMEVPSALQSRLLSRFDTAGSGVINYDNFLKSVRILDKVGEYNNFSTAVARSSKGESAASKAPSKLTLMERFRAFSQSDCGKQAVQLLQHKLAASRSHLRSAFRMLDADHDGVISGSELRQSLKGIGDGRSPALVDSVQELVDLLASHPIDYDTFTHLFREEDPYAKPTAGTASSTKSCASTCDSSSAKPRLWEQKHILGPTRFSATVIKDTRSVIEAQEGTPFYATERDRLSKVSQAGLVQGIPTRGSGPFCERSNGIGLSCRGSFGSSESMIQPQNTDVDRQRERQQYANRLSRMREHQSQLASLVASNDEKHARAQERALDSINRQQLRYFEAIAVNCVPVRE